MNLNDPDVDNAVYELNRLLESELATEKIGLLPATRAALSAPGRRHLPGARWVRMRAATHPNRERHWSDRVKPWPAVRAFYDHLRTAPSGVLTPRVDRSREHPGSTDAAIVTARRLLLEAVAEAAAEAPLRGTEPDAYRMVRAADGIVEAGQSWREAMKDALVAQW